MAAIPGDPSALTCGNCALVCGKNFREPDKRWRALGERGLVVPGPRKGEMLKISTYTEAVEMRMRYPRKVEALRMAKDALFFFLIWHRNHFGFRPRSALEGLAYARKLARAGKEHRQTPDWKAGHWAAQILDCFAGECCGLFIIVMSGSIKEEKSR